MGLKVEYIVGKKKFVFNRKISKSCFLAKSRFAVLYIFSSETDLKCSENTNCENKQERIQINYTTQNF
jgi:hypothetical protein